MRDTERVGWFDIPGVQEGPAPSCRVEDRIHGLEFFEEGRKRIHGAVVWDLGCAEGLIGDWLVRVSGCGVVYGVDASRDMIETGSRGVVNRGYVKLHRADLNDPPETWGIPTRPGPDVILALSVLHKLRKPALRLREWLSFDPLIVALRAPEEGLNETKDGRFWAHQAREIMAEEDFVLRSATQARPDMGLGWLGIYDKT